MFRFDNNILFTAIEFGSIMNKWPFMMLGCLWLVLALVIEKKLQLSQRFENYRVSKIEGAFRWTQNGGNFGNMVIDMKLDVLVLVSQISFPF